MRTPRSGTGTVPTRERGNEGFPAWFKSRLQPWGGWGRRPQRDAPRSEASPWGLAGYCQLDPSHPASVTRGSVILNHAGFPRHQAFDSGSLMLGL